MSSLVVSIGQLQQQLAIIEGDYRIERSCRTSLVEKRQALDDEITHTDASRLELDVDTLLSQRRQGLLSAALSAHDKNNEKKRLDREVLEVRRYVVPCSSSAPVPSATSASTRQMRAAM